MKRGHDKRMVQIHRYTLKGVKMNMQWIKRLLCFVLLIAVFTLSGCRRSRYVFRQSVDEIVSVDIADGRDCYNPIVLKSLNDYEREVFFEKFDRIIFQSDIANDPSGALSVSFVITYNDGAFEIIDHFRSYYMNDGFLYPIPRFCDEQKFKDLMYELYPEAILLEWYNR